MGAVAVLTGEVRAEGVGKTIDETTLLLPTDVSADPGECIVLRGPNGSGKTTLLRIIGGLLVPSTGTATIGGREADERDRAVRAAVAALLGAPTTYRDLTLVDHLVLIDSTWGGDPATSDDRSLALLDRLGIAHLDDRFPHELSSGQEQLFRLALTFSRPVERRAARRAGAAARHRQAPGRRRADPRAHRVRRHRRHGLPRPRADGQPRDPRRRHRPGALTGDAR